MTLENMYRRLQAAGYTVKHIELDFSGPVGPAISVDTNYDGPYPTKETNRLHAELERIVRKNHLHCEPRGYWTAMYIW